MMKKIITLALALTLTNIAHSADWTPVFKHLQHQNTGEEGCAAEFHKDSKGVHLVLNIGC